MFEDTLCGCFRTLTRSTYLNRLNYIGRNTTQKSCFIDHQICVVRSTFKGHDSSTTQMRVLVSAGNLFPHIEYQLGKKSHRSERQVHARPASLPIRVGVRTDQVNHEGAVLTPKKTQVNHEGAVLTCVDTFFFYHLFWCSSSCSSSSSSSSSSIRLSSSEHTKKATFFVCVYLRMKPQTCVRRLLLSSSIKLQNHMEKY